MRKANYLILIILVVVPFAGYAKDKIVCLMNQSGYEIFLCKKNYDDNDKAITKCQTVGLGVYKLCRSNKTNIYLYAKTLCGFKMEYKGLGRLGLDFLNANYPTLKVLPANWEECQVPSFTTVTKKNTFTYCPLHPPASNNECSK